jgi:hypothetical protein
VSRKFSLFRFSHDLLLIWHSQNKSQPKPATAAKAANTARGRGARRGRRGGARSSNRPKPKTVEELDAEMVDYFAGNENGGPADANAPTAANGAVQQPAAGGEDLGMAEISVSFQGTFMLSGRTDTDLSCSKCFMMCSFFSRSGRSLSY